MAGIGSGNALYPDGSMPPPGGPGGLPGPEFPLPGMSLPPNDMMNLSGKPPRKKRTFLKWIVGLAAGAGTVALAVWGSRRYAMNKFVDKMIAVANKPSVENQASEMEGFLSTLFSHFGTNNELSKITKKSAPDALKESWWARWGGNRFLRALALNPSPKGLEKFLEKLKAGSTNVNGYEAFKKSMLEHHAKFTGKKN